MKQIAMTVNGRPVTESVEPRLNLADLLREKLQLTGTHLGCENGVCGTCTVVVDGAPVRSCLIFAVALNGAEVRTIEGFDDDEVICALRAAFSPGSCTAVWILHTRDADHSAGYRIYVFLTQKKVRLDSN